MPKKTPTTPTLEEEYLDLRKRMESVAARAVAETADVKPQQVYKTRDGRLIRVIRVEEKGSVVFRCIHSPPGLAILPYDAEFRVFDFQRPLILNTKISD